MKRFFLSVCVSLGCWGAWAAGVPASPGHEHRHGEHEGELHHGGDRREDRDREFRENGPNDRRLQRRDEERHGRRGARGEDEHHGRRSGR